MSTWFNTKVSGTTREVLASRGSNCECLISYIGADNKLRLAVKDSSGNLLNLITTN